MSLAGLECILPSQPSSPQPAVRARDECSWCPRVQHAQAPRPTGTCSSTRARPFAIMRNAKTFAITANSPLSPPSPLPYTIPLATALPDVAFACRRQPHSLQALHLNKSRSLSTSSAGKPRCTVSCSRLPQPTCTSPINTVLPLLTQHHQPDCLPQKTAQLLRFNFLFPLIITSSALESAAARSYRHSI